MDSSKVSVLKAISWRFVATVLTMVIAWYITGEAKFAASIGILDAIFKLIAYYLHERAWIRLRFRKQPAALEQQATLE